MQTLRQPQEPELLARPANIQTEEMLFRPSYIFLPSLLLASTAVNPNVKIISPNEIEGQTVGPQGETIINRVAVNPNEARIFKQSVHDTPNSHSEMKTESSMYVKYGDAAKEHDALKQFIHGSDFDVPAVKAAGESMVK